jgi:type I restriction enzyme S subunit
MNSALAWQSVVLRDLCEVVQYGYTASATDKPVGPKFLRITDIVPETIDWSCVPYCEIDPQKLDKYLLRRGDIVIARTGATTGYAKYIRNAPEVVFASYLVRIRLRDNVDNRYAGYVVESSDYKRFIQATWGGAAQPNANAQVLTSYEMPLPPLPTQHKIASILSAYDNLIENNLRRINILEEMAQNLYREWFVKFRFPGHEKVQMVDSPLGKIPEEWEVVPLEDICSRITDGAHRSPKTVDIGYPMASVKDMHDLGINVDTCRKISEEDFKKLVRNDCKMLKNDVLIAKDGSYLKHCFVVEKDIDVSLLSSIAMLRPNERIRPHVLAMILRDSKVKTRMKGYVSGAALPRIILKEFRKFEIVLPPFELQKEWAGYAEQMIELCFRLIKKNTTLRRTRDLLLPKLISGELDVSDLDIKTGGHMQ